LGITSPSIIIVAEPAERRSVGCGGAALGFLGLSHDQKNDACVKLFRDACVNFFRSGSAQPQARVARTPYVCPLPDEVDPPLKMSA
jgi:hypothetical protein